ncbi:mCG146334, partial [Mus musculus]
SFSSSSQPTPTPCNYNRFSSLKKPTWISPPVTLDLWAQDDSSRGSPELPHRTALVARPLPGGCPSPPSGFPEPPGGRSTGRLGAWPLSCRALPPPTVLSALSLLRADLSPWRTKKLQGTIFCVP